MIFNQLQSLGSPRRFYHFCGLLVPWTFGIFILAALYGVSAGLFVVPRDYQQGDAFRILYVHVPCAMFSLLIYTAMATLSAIYLIWRIKIAEIMAFAIAPIGACLTFCALLTGAIWGKPMWGTWWIWDARLTSELILLFLYLGYLALYYAIPQPKTAAKACAILALVGAVDIPIIHYSVYWWSTLHQGATISKWGRPAIDSSMLMPLLSMIVAFASYTIAVGCLRARSEILRRNQQQLWVNKLIK